MARPLDDPRVHLGECPKRAEPAGRDCGAAPFPNLNTRSSRADGTSLRGRPARSSDRCQDDHGKPRSPLPLTHRRGRVGSRPSVLPSPIGRWAPWRGCARAAGRSEAQVAETGGPTCCDERPRPSRWTMARGRRDRSASRISSRADPDRGASGAREARDRPERNSPSCGMAASGWRRSGRGAGEIRWRYCAGADVRTAWQRRPGSTARSARCVRRWRPYAAGRPTNWSIAGVSASGCSPPYRHAPDRLPHDARRA